MHLVVDIVPGLWYNTCMEIEKNEIIMNDYDDNWTDNTEDNEDAVFLTQEEYDAEMKKVEL